MKPPFFRADLFDALETKMRTLMLLLTASLVLGCSAGGNDAGTALNPPPAPNTSTAPGTADPNAALHPVGASAMPRTPGMSGTAMPVPGATGG